MSTWGKQSHLPKEALITNSAVPVFTSAGDASNLFFSGTVEMDYLAFQNSTSTTINITVCDASAHAEGGLSSFPVYCGSANIVQFPANPLNFVGGLRMWAVSAGVFVVAQGWGVANYSRPISAV